MIEFLNTKLQGAKRRKMGKRYHLTYRHIGDYQFRVPLLTEGKIY